MSTPSSPAEQRAVVAASAPLHALGLQYGRFVLVGIGATAIHVLIYSGSIELLGAAPLLANALGFASGVNVSYVGHRRWTFRGTASGGRRSLVRFWAVALFGFALNSAFVQLVTGTLQLHYGWSVPLIAGVTPVLSFAISKWWAFRD
jgi:putative flippase GtrA